MLVACVAGAGFFMVKEEILRRGEELLLYCIVS